jgi:hypothetical protein
MPNLSCQKKHIVSDHNNIPFLGRLIYTLEQLKIFINSLNKPLIEFYLPLFH